jgi:hypothetical protein
MWRETWNLSTLYRAGAMTELIKGMDKYKIDTRALQKIRLPGKGTVITNNYLILYSGHKSDKYEFGTEFYISKYIRDEN